LEHREYVRAHVTGTENATLKANRHTSIPFYAFAFRLGFNQSSRAGLGVCARRGYLLSYIGESLVAGADGMMPLLAINVFFYATAVVCVQQNSPPCNGASDTNWNGGRNPSERIKRSGRQEVILFGETHKKSEA
jgi:hypothetical protein